MAIVLAACERKEKVLIVAPSAKQSEIIMHAVIDHLFDSPDITDMLKYDPFSIERLKKERSKERITLVNDSEMFVLTADVRTVSKNALGLMGFGATIVIADEAALIPDDMFSKILRMVGGVPNGKLIKLGNTFERNHFFKSLHSSRYEKVIIDYHQGIEEGRVTQAFIDEAKEDMSPYEFSILYECKFPQGSSDSLIPLDWIELAVNQKDVSTGKKQSGLDVARYGNDSSVYGFRNGGNVIKLDEVSKMDTMAVVGFAGRHLDRDEPDTTVVDIVGIGSGVFDRLEELGYNVFALSGGSSPIDPDEKEKFFNLRALMYWNLRTQFKPENGKSKISIPDDPHLIKELMELRYKYTSDKKMRMEDKDDFKKRVGRSPDKADALAYTFFDVEGMEAEMVIV